MSMEKTLGEIEGMLRGGNGNMDMSALMAMMNNKGLGGDNWWIIILFFLLNRNGLGGDNQTASAIEGQIEAAINKASANQASFAAIKDAVMNNGADLRQLASTLNCDVNSLQLAISDIKAGIGMVEKEIGCSADKVMGAIATNGERIINAIVNGNCDIRSAISQCCCDVLRTIENKFADLALRDQSNTNAILLAIQSSTQASKDSANTTQQMILQTQQIFKDTAKDAEIRELTNKLEDKSRNEQTATIIAALGRGRD